MKIKTSGLTGAALDWAVMIALGHKVFPSGDLNAGKFGPLFGKTEYGAALGVRRVRPSTDWSQGGPIIEREFMDIETMPCDHAYENVKFDTWRAWVHYESQDAVCASGPTLLIAAIRCYVASKLGDEVDVPEELTQASAPESKITLNPNAVWPFR